MQPFSPGSISLHLSFQEFFYKKELIICKRTFQKVCMNIQFFSIIFDMFFNLHCACLRTYAILGSSA
jgi:hypothetical protein